VEKQENYKIRKTRDGVPEKIQGDSIRTIQENRDMEQKEDEFPDRNSNQIRNLPPMHPAMQNNSVRGDQNRKFPQVMPCSGLEQLRNVYDHCVVPGMRLQTKKVEC
jgi:hypothetical protein